LFDLGSGHSEFERIAIFYLDMIYLSVSDIMRRTVCLYNPVERLHMRCLDSYATNREVASSAVS
jgi:hypothetical protein